MYEQLSGYITSGFFYLFSDLFLITKGSVRVNPLLSQVLTLFYMTFFLFPLEI